VTIRSYNSSIFTSEGKGKKVNIVCKILDTVHYRKMQILLAAINLIEKKV